MPIVLFRVDERLIHGQVVVGWSRLDPQRVVVIDDEIARSAWEQELYSLGLPSGVEAEFVEVEEARRRYSGWQADPLRTIVLVRGVATLRRLGEGALLKGQEVNLGGIHHAPGRERQLSYLFLSGEERADLRAVADSGAQVVARDLPSSRAVPLEELLHGRSVEG